MLTLNKFNLLVLVFVLLFGIIMTHIDGILYFKYIVSKTIKSTPSSTFKDYQDSIHYQDSFSATIVIVNFYYCSALVCTYMYLHVKVMI